MRPLLRRTTGVCCDLPRRPKVTVDHLPPNFTFHDVGSAAVLSRDEILAGMRAAQKTLPPKLFYDAWGSAQFNAICETEAYYVTRTELAILARHAQDIQRAVGDQCIVIEPGPGDMSKFRLLLSHLRPLAYLAIDVSPNVEREGLKLAQRFPWLQVISARADFENGLDQLPLPKGGRRVIFFPGSTIGNLEPHAVPAFLKRQARVAGAAGGVILGVDLQKDEATLNLAYNDPQGLTRDFNLNVLTRLNREFDGTFDLSHFEHRAFYNSLKTRIEMHLVSRVDQSVVLSGETVRFTRGESIHTENSYKYTIDSMSTLAASCGLIQQAVWTDARKFFAEFYFSVK